MNYCKKCGGVMHGVVNVVMAVVTKFQDGCQGYN